MNSISNKKEIYLRLAFVFILFFRFGIVIATERFYFGAQHYKYLDGALLIILSLILYGRFTPICYIILNILIVIFDQLHGISTLGTTIACLTSFTLIANSLNTRIKNSKFDFVVKIEVSSRNFLKRIITARLLHYYAIVGYSLCSFCALCFHLNDSNWIEGKTLASILKSSYLCRFHSPFLFLDLNFPYLLSIISIVGCLGQGIFQISMLFSLFSKNVYYFTKYWGWIFIILCTLLLHLSHLPFIEIILWYSIFHGFSGLGRFNKSFINKINFFSFRSLCVNLIFILFLFFNFSIPFVGNLSALINLSKPNLEYFKMIGLDIPYVFNSDDLNMSNHWLCLYRTGKATYPDINQVNQYLNMLNQSESEKTYHLVPITKPNGEKDLYQYSDLLYYGNSLWYRRFLSTRDLIDSHKSGSYFSNLIEARILFDFRLNDFQKPKLYLGNFHQTVKNEKKLSSSKVLFSVAYFVHNSNEIEKVF